MRGIKFRVWDKGSMHSVQRLIWSGLTDEVFAYDDGGSNNLLSADILMQYTGLKDKNGVEIYEGDIVRILYTDWPSQSDSDPRSFEQYLNDIAEVKVIVWKVQGFYASHSVDGYAESMEPGTHGFIEVIGNIHENPQLLDD